MHTKLDDPEYWSARAEEVRTLAEGMSDAGRELLLNIAEDYELLASLATSRLHNV